MTDENKKSLKAAEIDVEGAIERFVFNEGLYQKFLLKFLQDKNYMDLMQAVENKDAEAAYRCAHALKGVSANLGLQGIANPLQELVQIVRAGSVENTEALMESLQQAYESCCAAIKQLDN